MSSKAVSSVMSFQDWYQLHLKAEGRRCAQVWLVSFVGVGCLAGVMVWQVLMQIERPPAVVSASLPPAIAIDMSPLPSVAPAPPQDVPAGPAQTVLPSEPAELPKTPVPAMVSSAAPVVPVPKAEKVKTHKSKSKAPASPIKPLPVQSPVASTVSAPPAAEGSIAAGAKETSVKPSHSSHNISTWQGDILARLESFKRYPAQALSEHQEGIPLLYFVLDRQGHLVHAHIQRSTGYTLLDEEALAMVHRAEPFPAPPGNVEGNTISLSVPLDFSIND